jgi:hypothetical protein
MCISIVLLACCASATLVTISNVLPRVDIYGKPMDIHDGNIIQYEKDGLITTMVSATMEIVMLHWILAVLESSY